MKDSKSTNLLDLKSEISKKLKLSMARIRLTLENGKNATDPLRDDIVIFKDLGPQIQWKLVFLLEYFGPILIHSLFYQNLGFKSDRISLCYLLTIIHYSKRELETVFVHRFSSETMPWTNLPKNCFHYWVLGGLLVAYPLYSPHFTPKYGLEDSFTLPLVAIWAFAQASNFITHLNLRSLRPAGTTERRVPKGYGFDLVTAPNYFFEILGWICYSLLTGSLNSWLFTVVGAVQMWFWAAKKHQRYKNEFGKEYPKRKILIPFLL